MLVLLAIFTVFIQVGTEAAVLDDVNRHALPMQDDAQDMAGTSNTHPLAATTFADCAGLFPVLYWTNGVQDGVYPIKPESSSDHFDVYCDMTTNGGRWTVIQRRFDGHLNFVRNWADYKNGFGRVEGEHWLGLDKMHALTTQDNYELYVQLEDWEGNTAYAKYDAFSIGDESTGYTLNIGGYSGDAGDSMGSYHNGMKFSARDVDNDIDNSYHCAQFLSGGWWYRNCAYSNLNGPYFWMEDYHGTETGQGVKWHHWKGRHYSLKATKMMVRPRNFARKL
ncbi:microfibril-associated glycoprotein 4-like isoform X2 [Branchiostoma lanceolatum]